MLTLEDIGWNAGLARAFQPHAARGWLPARLIRDNRITLGALLAEGEELEVVTSGRVYHEAETDAELPAVGDWVALERGDDSVEAVIRARLPRQTFFSRKVPGDSAEEQILAANIDLVAVVTDAGEDFSPRRLERYLALIARGGAGPLILLNKCDLFSDAENEAAAEAVRALQPGLAVHVVSARRRKGLKAVRDCLQRGVTMTFIGSSGVGKSALVNRLLGEEWQWTGEVNEVTGKGRHTTTARELLVLPRGGIIIDNPGIKEVQMWTDETTLRERFADVEALAATCRFSDCRHGSDAGCAIRAAVADGTLDQARHQAFLQLDDEITALRRRRKKRQMTLERRQKREHRVKARNHADRREIEAETRFRR